MTRPKNHHLRLNTAQPYRDVAYLIYVNSQSRPNFTFEIEECEEICEDSVYGSIKSAIKTTSHICIISFINNTADAAATAAIIGKFGTKSHFAIAEILASFANRQLRY